MSEETQIDSEEIKNKIRSWLEGNETAPTLTHPGIEKEKLNISVTYKFRDFGKCITSIENEYEDELPDWWEIDETKDRKLAETIAKRIFEEEFEIRTTMSTQISTDVKHSDYYVTIVY